MRKRLTPGVVLGIVALVVAMTGSAVGASLITGKQVKNSSLTGKDIKNKSLTKKDFKGSVRGARGLTGPQGPQGPQGATGPAGTSELATLTDNFGSLDIAAGDVDGGELSCDDGQKIVSGGFEYTAPDGKGRIVASEANETLDGWLVVLDNSENTAAASVSADALCAAAGQPVATPARAHMQLRRTSEVRRIVARVKRAG
jgi:hypothetical protein